VVEEVSLDKKVDHRDEVIRDTVRKTEVDIQDIPNKDRRTNREDDAEDLLEQNRYRRNEAPEDVQRPIENRD
jgi:hypothetical protein